MRDEYIPLYKQCKDYLNIEARKERIATRFNCFTEIFDHITIEIKKKTFINFMKGILVFLSLILFFVFSKNFLFLFQNK